MNAYTAISNPELFIQKQIATFDGTAAPDPTLFTAVLARCFALPLRCPVRAAQQSSKRLRTGLTSSAAIAPSPVVCRPARTVRGPFLSSPRTSPFLLSAPGGRHVPVSSKVHITHFPQGCATSGCTRRHIPAPLPGQFSATDKAEVLASLLKMKGTTYDRVGSIALLRWAGDFLPREILEWLLVEKPEIYHQL